MDLAVARLVDLHTHTNFSDGTFTPLKLINEAVGLNLSAIAVTDHDTVAGLRLSLESAVGKDFEVLPGIELSAEYDGSEIHILGYLIDYENKKLLKQLDILQKNRIERVYKMVEKLNGLGLEFKAEDVFSAFPGSIVGRLHVARTLLRRGLVTSTQEAFHKYIGDTCPAYVLGFKLSPSAAIQLIRGAGGIPVLAHPYTIKSDTLLLELIKEGIMGLEAYYPEHSQAVTNFYLNLAKENNLLVTGGSDFHGDGKPGVKLGCLKVYYELVDELKNARERL